LEANRYNPITATYFLLAERVLKERQQKESHGQIRSASPSKAQFRYWMCTVWVWIPGTKTIIIMFFMMKCDVDD